jgi:hypothetical protein
VFSAVEKLWAAANPASTGDVGHAVPLHDIAEDHHIHVVLKNPHASAVRESILISRMNPDDPIRIKRMNPARGAWPQGIDHPPAGARKLH